MNRFLPFLLTLLVADLALADTNAVTATNGLNGEKVFFKGMGSRYVVTNRIDKGTLAYENGELVFSYPAITNHYPLADSAHKPLPIPGAVVVNISEVVMTTHEGDANGVLVLHLRTTAGQDIFLKAGTPLPVTRQTWVIAQAGGRTNYQVWKPAEAEGAR